MNSVRKHFAPALRKVPGIVVGVFDADRLEVTALGTLEHEPDPASLCWEIGSITKVFTGILLAEMSIRGEVGLNDPIGLYVPNPVAGRLPAAALQPTLADLATVDDLMRLVRACLDPPDGTIGEALDFARRPFYEHRLPFGDKGLGWMLRSLDRRRRRTETIWHNRGTFGASSFLAIDVPTARAIIVLGNAGPGVIPPLDGPAWAVFDSLGG